MGALKRPRKRRLKDQGPLTEARIQNLIAETKCERHLMSVPNTGEVWVWESDVASITTAGLTHDFEVKVSRADWLAERRKVEEGDIRQGKKAYRDHVLRHAKEIAALIDDPKPRKTIAIPGLKLREKKGFTPPNYFWVVTVEGVANPQEIPDYAGWIEVVFNEKQGRFQLEERWKAPRLHGLGAHERQWRAMARGLSARVWSERKRQSRKTT